MLISNIKFVLYLVCLLWCCFVFYVFGVLAHSCAVFGVVLFCVSVYLVFWCILCVYFKYNIICAVFGVFGAFFVFISNMIIFVLYLLYLVHSLCLFQT